MIGISRHRYDAVLPLSRKRRSRFYRLDLAAPLVCSSGVLGSTEFLESSHAARERNGGLGRQRQLAALLPECGHRRRDAGPQCGSVREPDHRRSHKHAEFALQDP